MKTATLVLVLFFGIHLGAMSQVYDFPIKPGDEEWKSFTTSEQMYSACQIPVSVLKKMNTRDLALTCLNYPLISSIFAYNDLQAGYNALASRFNGFRELEHRENAGEILIKIYQGMSPNALDTDWNSVEQGRFCFEFTYIEVLLAQRKIQGNLSGKDKKRLVTATLDKLNQKEKHLEVFGTHGTSTSAWVMARALRSGSTAEVSDKEKASSIELARYAFLEQGLVIDSQVIDEIVTEGKAFVK